MHNFNLFTYTLLVCGSLNVPNVVSAEKAPQKNISIIAESFEHAGWNAQSPRGFTH
ncbi:hypothetical protein RS130_00130 [Paraglaciecola aquimarina]|uniref:Uncharacterized protein n=1 Tax=Paraglaciecola aquimarina TaxID=1235557 RepID=A0ABU3SR90_9ALTE|nr:hypothetical protein [Paraglaciecola aquimarina]MDU0352521.1 hypothetical protein [Paraglaciecola aquimarina]